MPADPQPDFPERTTRLLDSAAASCERRGVRLTGLRRQVLGLVLDSEKPAGAYELLDRLRPRHKGAAPQTVYRALDFLLEQGLIHKVERLAAFVGCVHAADHDEHEHAVQFLICQRCGTVQELSDPAIGGAMARAAREAGFTLLGSTVEADGICAACAAIQRSAPPAATP
jgi:Fur family transcriptional regulator, zinc uptake regulator